MGFLATIANLFSGGVLGSITGLIGSYYTGKNKLETMRMKYQHDEVMADKAIDTITAKAQAGVKIAQEQTKGAESVADIKARETLYKQSSKRLFDKSYMAKLPKFVQSIIAFMFSQVDILRAVIRPTLAIVYTIAFLFIAIKSYLTNPAAFIASSVLIIDFIIFVVSSVTAFYFNDRALTKHIDKVINPPDTSWHEVDG